MTPRSDDLLTRDAEARSAAQSEFKRPLVLEAGAGTGKTTTLVARIVVWCMGPGWEMAADRGHDSEVAARVLRRVVAITFTDAAAAEMETRVAATLHDVEAGKLPEGVEAQRLPADLEVRRRRARALLGTLDRLVVQTIHAFCRRLLVAHPLEAGVHPRFEVDADGAHREEIAREVVAATLQEAYSDPPDPDYLVLAREKLGPPEIATALEELVAAGVSGAALAGDPLSVVRVREFKENLRAALEPLLTLAHALESTPTARAVAAAVQQLSDLVASAELSSVDEFESFAERFREIATKPVRNRLVDWARNRAKPTEYAAFGSHADTIVAAAKRLVPEINLGNALYPRRLEAARTVLRRLLQKVEEELHTRGIATFPMLLDAALGLLERHPAITAEIRRGIDQLLVDEFQDTDPTQCRIVTTLALSGPAEGRPGLFVVGDPKQSIYGWRSADLRSYAEFLSEIEREQGQVHLLSRNHRSARAILEQVDAVIEPCMHEATGLQPHFEPLVPRPNPPEPFAEGVHAPVEYWISWDFDAETRLPRPKTLAPVASEIESKALALDLRELHDRHGVRWNDIGVLFRTRNDLEPYLGELRALAIPYQIDGDRSYYQRREIIECSALIRTVLDPNDHLALLTVLRSAFVAVPDVALVPLWIRDLPSRVTDLDGSGELDELVEVVREVAARLAELDVQGLTELGGWEQNLISALRAVDALRAAFETEPADRFVELLRRLFLMEATEAARYQGPYRLANLERFFDRLVDDLTTAGADPHTLLRRLRRRISEASAEEEARPRESTLEAIRICTIHQSKGLEFEHVYLMQLHRQKPPRRSEFVSGWFGESFEYRILGAPTLGIARLEARREEVEAAERVRSLYVAMTRAKRRLVLACAWAEQPARAPDDAQSHADLLKQRGPGTPDLRQAAGELTGDRFDAHSARWVFPALLAGEGAGGPKAGRAAGLATPEEIRSDADRIERDRIAALKHASRPFRATASDESRHELRRGEPDRGSAAGFGRPAALAVGTAIHRVLEELDLFADPGPQLESARQTVQTELSREFGGPDLETAITDAHDILEKLERGSLLEKLRGLRDLIVARELPLQFAPSPDPFGAVGFVAGAIDMVYRDPETNAWVVADFKTDRVDSQEARARAESYAAQGCAYTRALQNGLGLDHEPRFELWFLRADRIEVPAPVPD